MVEKAEKSKSELDLNIEAYNKMEKKLLEKHLGKIALFSGGELINTYNDKVDAYNIGLNTYGAGKFSIKEIGEKPHKLGFVGLSISATALPA